MVLRFSNINGNICSKPWFNLKLVSKIHHPMPAKCLATTRTKKVQQRHISSTITWALRAFSTVGGCQGIPCNCRAVGCCTRGIWEDIDRRYWNLILDTICIQTHILYSKHWNNASSRIQKEFKSTITLNVECQEGLAVPSTTASTSF